MAKSSRAKRPKKSIKPLKKQVANLKASKPKAKLKATPAKPKAKSSDRQSSAVKRAAAKSAVKPKRNVLKKAVANKSKKPASNKLTARKPVAVKKPAAGKSQAKISPKGKKISQKRDIGHGKLKVGPKIARALVRKAVNPAVRSSVASASTNLSKGAMQNGTKKDKNFKMSTNIINNQKEVSPGGGVVLPATKSAPAMNLRADDAAILASAKERYGRKDLDAFKSLLIEQMQEAKEEFEILSQNILDTSGEFEADNQNYAMHTAEQGTDAIEREKTFLHAQRTSDYIKKLEEALERIDRGIYGICVVCGLLIEKGRLQAVPITQKHVDCKNRTQTKKPSGSSGFRDHEEQPPPANVD